MITEKYTLCTFRIMILRITKVSRCIEDEGDIELFNPWLHLGYYPVYALLELFCITN